MITRCPQSSISCWLSHSVIDLESINLGTSLAGGTKSMAHSPEGMRKEAMLCFLAPSSPCEKIKLN